MLLGCTRADDVLKALRDWNVQLDVFVTELADTTRLVERLARLRPPDR